MSEIRITCKGAFTVPIKDLKNFQGNLKKLSDKDYKKIRAAIEKHGFSFPMNVWRHNGTHDIIDGHQRLVCVERMIKEGWTLKSNALPVDWIEAKNRKEAKEKVLLAASQYGKVDIGGLGEFIEDAGLDLKDVVDTVALPSIDLNYLFEGPEELPDVNIEGDKTPTGEYLIIQFDTGEQYQTIHDTLGLRGKTRIIKWEDFLERCRQFQKTE